MDKILVDCEHLRTLIIKMEHDHPFSPIWSPSPFVNAVWITELIWSAEVILQLDEFLPLCLRLELLVINSDEIGSSDGKRVLQRVDLLCPSLRHIYCLDSETISSLDIDEYRRPPSPTLKRGLQSITISDMRPLKDVDLAPLLKRNHDTLESISVAHTMSLDQYCAIFAAWGAKHLKRLCLKYPGPAEFLSQMIEQCPALEEVTLTHCCSNMTLYVLSKLKNLRSLSIIRDDQDDDISEGAFAFVKAAAASPSMLTKFHLQAECVTDSLLENLGQIKSLKNVNLKHSTRLTAPGLLRFIELLATNTQIESLNLADVDAVTDTIILALGRRLKYVHDLDMSGCSNISDSGALYLTFMKRLKRLLLKDHLPSTHRTSYVEEAIGMVRHIAVSR
ncbi:hypothetical protein BX666DRAFT_663516 [Dichotomocladium elegans]|nr:hypothetical protein BX666DRAFT_663516 [Dichotomocladium elegans]